MGLTYIDLFCGAGGWGCGLQMAGLKHRGSYDINSSASRTAKANLSDLVFCTDLTQFDPKVESMQADLIVGSPPCQGFSNEGYKKETDPRNSLVWTYFDLIDKLSPSVFIFENVPGFKRLYQGSYYEALKKRLSSMPYYWNSFILDCSHYGVPQKRRRFFVIGAKEFHPDQPPQSHSDFGEVLGTNKIVTLWEAISDLPQVGIGERTGIFDYQKPPESPYQTWIREGSQKVYNHTTQNHSQRVLEKIRAVPQGEGMKAFIDNYEENKVNYCGGYRRALKHRPSYTAYWTRGMTSIHPEADRFLSPRECARIQSFPDRFIFQGTTIENYTQVCNAVPPLVARAFGRYLLKILKGQDIPATPWEVSDRSENNRETDNPDPKIHQENFPVQLKLPF